MRLSAYEKEKIINTARSIFNYNAKVILFGSRVNDEKKGGDIDLLIIPGSKIKREDIFEKKMSFLVNLKDIIGEQKIDVIIKYKNDNRGIISTALKKGIALC